MKKAKAWLPANSSPLSTTIAVVAAITLIVGLSLWSLASWMVSNQSTDIRAQSISTLFGALIQYISAAIVGGTFWYIVKGYGQDKERHGKEEKQRQYEEYHELIKQLYSSERLPLRMSVLRSLKRWIVVNDSYWSKLDAELVEFIKDRAEEVGLDRQPPPDARVPRDIAAALSLLGKRNDRPHVDALKIKLSALNFPGLTLADADLSGVDLTDTVFDNATFDWVILDGADLTNFSLRNSTVVNTKLSGANASNADFSGTKFHLVDWDGLQAKGAIWAGSNVNPDELPIDRSGRGGRRR